MESTCHCFDRCFSPSVQLSVGIILRVNSFDMRAYDDARDDESISQSKSGIKNELPALSYYTGAAERVFVTLPYLNIDGSKREHALHYTNRRDRPIL